MPQSKKRKKNNVPSRKPLKSYTHLSKHYIVEFERVAYQIMKMAGIDASEYASLTKRTRQQLMLIKWTPYRILAQPGSRVPKIYVKLYNQMMTKHEEHTFYGDPEYKVSYLDYVTYGLSFIFAIRNPERLEESVDQQQYEVLCRLKEAITKHMEEYESAHYLVRTNYVMKLMSMHLSSPIYRYYNSKDDLMLDYGKGRAQNTIWVSSVQPETKCFKIQNEKHKGYRLRHYDIISEMHEPNPTESTVPLVMLEEDDFETAIERLKEQEDKRLMPVYVQGHVIHRIRQRLDCMDNYYMNQVLSCTFLLPQSVRAVTGQRLIKAFDPNENTVGYFPFVVQNNSVLLLSFLPLSSPITPEGSKLQKALGINVDDSKYIGFDKLSFFVQTDFDKLPQLKDALQKADMWHLTEIQPSDKLERREDRLLERFFGEKKV